MPAARGRRQAVTLRDFLELACESSSNGFRSYPRRLPSSETLPKASSAVSPAVGTAGLSRSPSSWSPSAFFFPSKRSPGSALARISSLSRSFSRRISFWRRRDEYDDLLFDRDSCGLPSPLVSSCSASESSESELMDIVIMEETPAAVRDEVSASSSVVDDRDCTDDVPCAAGDGHEALADGDPTVGRKLETMEEDKRQLSPVSVLDFPFDDDDGDEEERSDAGTCSPSFLLQHHDCSANLQRKKKKASPQKIRRFDGPTTEAQVDLEARFTSESGEDSVDDVHVRRAHLPSSDSSCSTTDSDAAETTTAPLRHDYEEEEHRQRIIVDERSQQAEHADEYRLLAKLLDVDDDTAPAVDEISEWLLLDFFAEGIGSSVVGTAARQASLDHGNKLTAALVETAVDWLRGAGPQWGTGDVMFSGESALKDMERGRRWMCVREEEQDVGVQVEAFVMDGLVDELVTELMEP